MSNVSLNLNGARTTSHTSKDGKGKTYTVLPSNIVDVNGLGPCKVFSADEYVTIVDKDGQKHSVKQTVLRLLPVEQATESTGSGTTGQATRQAAKGPEAALSGAELVAAFRAMSDRIDARLAALEDRKARK